MDELSLYILDITMNSVRAGADDIRIRLEEKGNILTFTVSDNGCGMTKEQVERLTDPFFTTRKTRKVGLGIPFLKMIAEQTGGYVEVESRSKEEYPDSHGTVTRAVFHTDHIDFIPLGNITDTVLSLIQGSPDTNFLFEHETEKGCVQLSCEELRAILGDVSLGEYEVLAWIREYLNENYREIMQK